MTTLTAMEPLSIDMQSVLDEVANVDRRVLELAVERAKNKALQAKLDELQNPPEREGPPDGDS